jgi:hypothetical protein
MAKVSSITFGTSVDTNAIAKLTPTLSAYVGEMFLQQCRACHILI